MQTMRSLEIIAQYGVVIAFFTVVISGGIIRLLDWIEDKCKCR